MKNINVQLLSFACLLCSFLTAQEVEIVEDFPKNEIKLNMLYTVIGLPEITYERALDDNSSIGLSLAIGAEDDLDLKGMLIPYYRFYFGEKRPFAGFFIEGNLAILSYENEEYYDYNSTGEYQEPDVEDKISFGVGFAAGAKFLNKGGFIGEFYGGIGRNFADDDYIDVYPRAGISIGKRF